MTLTPEEKRERHRQANRLWRERNPDKAKEVYKTWRDKNSEAERQRCREYHHKRKDTDRGKFQVEKALLRTAKYKAKKRGLEFNIELSDIQIPDVCPILGIPIIKKIIVDGSKSGLPNSPSLDRVDNSQGYVKGNVRVVSLQGNVLKGANSIETLKGILNYLQSDVTV